MVYGYFELLRPDRWALSKATTLEGGLKLLHGKLWQVLSLRPRVVTGQQVRPGFSFAVVWCWESASRPFHQKQLSGLCLEQSRRAVCLDLSLSMLMATKQILHSTNKREMTHKATLQNQTTVIVSLATKTIMQLYVEKCLLSCLSSCLSYRLFLTSLSKKQRLSPAAQTEGSCS